MMLVIPEVTLMQLLMLCSYAVTDVIQLCSSDAEQFGFLFFFSSLS